MRGIKAAIGRPIVLVALGMLVTGQVAMAGGDDLSIRRISPSGTDVEPGQELTIQFDRDMVELGDMSRDSDELPVEISPDPGCQWRWLDTSQLACRLPEQHRFAPATHYTVTVDTELAALDGSHLAAPEKREFTTIRPDVHRAHFEKWQSATKPVMRVRTNMPVTADELADYLVFATDADDQVEVDLEPYRKERSGPIWLPVPDVPGAMLKVANPQPESTVDQHDSAPKGRRVWSVKPAHGLDPGQQYALRITPGMSSPAGPLPGRGERNITRVSVWDEFDVAGVVCNRGSDTIAPGDDPDATDRCVPDDVNLLFSAPVPRATLTAIQWDPVPLSDNALARAWNNYPHWFLRRHRGAHSAERASSFPLTFELDPMQTYTITVPKGVKDIFGRTLDHDVRVTWRTGHRRPSFDPPPHQAVLEQGENTIAPLRFTNLDSLIFDYRTLSAHGLATGSERAAADAPDMVERAAVAAAVHGDQRRQQRRYRRLRGHTPFAHALMDGRRMPGRYLFDSDRHRENLLQRPDLAGGRDANVLGPLGARTLLHGQSGVVSGALNWSPDAPYRPRSFTGIVTPWQVLAKVGYYGTEVWVTDLATGQPVANADVSLYFAEPGKLHDGERPGDTATTDADGMVHLAGTSERAYPFHPDADDDRELFVSVVKGDDIALLPLDYQFKRSIYAASNHGFFDDERRPGGHLRAWAVTAQGIYRPGSDVDYAAFLRDEGEEALKAAPDGDDWTYTLTITDPQDNDVLERKDVELADADGIAGTLHIASTAPMGKYRIDLQWQHGDDSGFVNAGSFMVTDFVPDSFQVHTTVRGERFQPGDSVSAEISAELHAGGPYTDADSKFTTRLEPHRFAPDTSVTNGFRFGHGELPDAQTLAEDKGKLDDTGHDETGVDLPEDSDVIYGNVRVEGAVQSARGTWVADRASVPYAARDRFVGLRTSDWLQQAREPFTVEYLVTDPTGKPQAGSDVELTLQRQTHKRVQVENGAGDFDADDKTKWQDQDSCTATSDTAPASCEFTPAKSGRYRVVATVEDTAGQTQRTDLTTYVTGAGHTLWSHDNGVTLVPDADHYAPGDTAHVMVQNPYPGAEALVTVERYGVLWKKRVTLEGSAPVVDVPIDKSFFPGAYLSVAIFSPRVDAPDDPDLGKPQLALGYTALKIHGPGSSLDVNVTPARDTYKPGQTASVDVDVGGDARASGSTRLVAAVVDQGVLDLLPEGTDYYDPRETFYAPPDGPDIANYSLAEQLMTHLQPKAGKGENPGGGGGEASGPNVRDNFSHSAYWNADLKMDASGHAHFEFELPDNLTRWRVLVIAMDDGAPMGLGKGDFRVNLPLQIEPALPNQMHVGDEFGAAFNVTNRTEDNQSVDTHLEAKGAIEDDEASADDHVNLASFEHALSWLPLVADAPGDIDLTASARAGELSDAVTGNIPVTRGGTEVVAAQYGSTTDADAEVPVKVPEKAVQDASKVTVTFSPTLVGGLEGAFEAMQEKHLDFWEMRLSKGVLASDYLQLKPVLGDAVDWPDADDTIAGMLDKAAAFQAPNGGMAFFMPRNKFVSDYLSVYTALAFDWLAEAGHEVPEKVRDPLRKYLRKDILETRDDADGDGPSQVLIAGAMAALAQDAHADLADGAVAGVVGERHDMRAFGKALLLNAAIAVDDRDSADKLLESLFNQAEESAGEISFNEKYRGTYAELLATPVRSNCAILDAFSRYKARYGSHNALGETPAKLMRWVADKRREDGGWPNSQENVFCTSAITHYADAYETDIGGLSGTLDLPDGKPQTVTFASRADAAKQLDGPAADPGEHFDVGVGHGGTGRLYYNVNVHYVMPADALPAADAGMTLKREYRVRRNGAWQRVDTDTSLERGDIVRVDLIVDTPTARHQVLLTDPLPGGFEAVNRNLATSAQMTPAEADGENVLMFDGGDWPNMSITTGGFYHRETGFDAVRFFAGNLPAGHYRLVYSAQVIAPGRFLAPTPTVKEIYHPDVFGRATPDHIEVAMPED